MDLPKNYQYRSPETHQTTPTSLPVEVKSSVTTSEDIVPVGDAIKHIFTFLPPLFLYKKIPFLNRRFNLLSRDDLIWKKVLQKNYPNLVVDSVPADPTLSWRDEFVKYLRLRKVCIKHLYTKHKWMPPLPIQKNDIGFVSSKEAALVFFSSVQDKQNVVFVNPTNGTILRTIECGKSISSFELKRNKLVLGDSQNNQFICHEFNDEYKFPIDDVKNVKCLDYDPSTKTIVLNRVGTDVINIQTAGKKDTQEIKTTGTILKAVLYKNLLFVHTNKEISQWSLETAELQRSYPYVTHSTEGRFIVHKDQIFILHNNTVKSYNIHTGAFAVAYNINNDKIYTIVMIDEYLYTSSYSAPDNALCRWNLNGRLECIFEKITPRFNLPIVAINPLSVQSGVLFGYCPPLDRIMFWDIFTGKLLRDQTINHSFTTFKQFKSGHFSYLNSRTNKIVTYDFTK